MTQFHKFISIAVLTMVASFTSPAYAERVNGNLHNKSVSAWNEASYTNKLSTAEDWYSAVKGYSTRVQIGGTDTVSVNIRKLMSCVDNAAYEMSVRYGDLEVAVLASACVKQLGL